MTTLLFSITFGSIGFAYFIYGKKQQRLVPLLSGVALCVAPYLVSGAVALTIVGTVLTATPWIARR